MNYISHRLIEDMHICYFIPHLPQNSGLLVINLDCSLKEDVIQRFKAEIKK